MVNLLVSQRARAAALLALLLLGCAVMRPRATAAETSADKTPAREIYVPFEELNVLLEGPVRRVLMSREEYEALLVKEKKNPTEKVPHDALLLSADYDVRLEDLRAQITAKLTCEVLADGLQGLWLEFGQVGIQEALLDGKPAALRSLGGGKMLLLLEGRGRHELTLKMFALLETNASEQTLNMRLPRLPASKLRVSAEGNVEVRSGADLISRSVDEAAGRTSLELLPTDGQMSLALSLNNRTRRKQRVVVARSVVVDEVTAAYERLHATVSLAILHQAVDKFRFAVPEGFEISEVQSPLMARWWTSVEGGKRILEVALRQETTEGVVLNIAAVRSPAKLEGWKFPELEPLDVAGRMAVAGLLLEDRLKAEEITAAGMLPIDNEVLTQALPASVFAAEPGAPRVRAVVAYYAPDGTIDMQAKFVRPPARVLATTNLLLSVTESGLDVRGGFALAAESEALHEFDFTAPAGWTVAEVTTDDGTQVPFERYGAVDAAGRVHVRLAKKIAPGTTGSFYFHARRVPPAWLDAWTTTNLEFPVFAAAGAGLDAGAISVDARDDLTVRPDVLTNLTPLDEAEQPKYGLVDVAGQLAYRYDAPGYRATLVVERTKPRLTCRTYSFFRVDSDTLNAHYELMYDIARARTRAVEFTLPTSTPAAVTVTGLDGVQLKEYSSTDGPNGRTWRALLSEGAQGRLRLAVNFQQPLPKDDKQRDIALPVVQAGGVAYQSGVVAIEGDSELDIEVTKHPRKVDVGELAEAEYRTGRRLLGAFGFVGDASATVINVKRRSALGLQPAIVQSARYVTVLGNNGRAQTSAEFLLRTKAGYLEAKLPADSTLWSVLLDGQATQPQREGDRLLLGFPSADGETLRTLKIAYETETARLTVYGRVRIPAIGLYLRAAPGAPPHEVPTADARWELRLPSNYRILRSDGTLTAERETRAEPLAVVNVAAGLFELAGGIGGPRIYSARETSVASNQRGNHNSPPRISLDQSAAMPVEGLPGAGRFGGGLGGGAGFGGKSPVLDGFNNLPQSEAKPQDALNAGPTINGGNFSIPNTATATISGSGGTLSTTSPALPDSLIQLQIEHDAMSAKFGPEHPKVKDLAKRIEKYQAYVDARQVEVESLNLKRGLNLPPIAPPPATPLPGIVAQAPNSPFPVVVPAASPSATAAPGKPATKIAGELTKSGSGTLDLAGVRSLKIDLQSTGEVAVFHSLGVDPKLDVTLIDRRRADGLAWVVAAVVFLYGLRLLRAPRGRNFRYLALVALVTTLLPLVMMRHELVPLLNPSFYAACWLVLVYLFAWIACGVVGFVRTHFTRPKFLGSFGATSLAVLLMAAGASAETPPAITIIPNSGGGSGTPVAIQVVPAAPPVRVPDDAVILLYRDVQPSGLPKTEQMLVPYDRYQELWNAANPQKVAPPRPPVPYSTTGAAFRSTLTGDDFLLLEGSIDYELFTDEFVQIPLPLTGGVLASATFDGKPARLTFPPAAPTPPQAKGQPMQQAAMPQAASSMSSAVPAPRSSPLVLVASGKGKHRLEIAVRLSLAKAGGWRIAEGTLPVAPATSLTLTVPQADTDVRLGGIPDRRSYTTTKAGEQITTALGSDGALRIEWRAKINSSQVDDSLKAHSDVVFAVQDDGLRLGWRTTLEFGTVRRERFTLVVPQDYLVERVTGRNVRGWEPRDDGGRRKLDVELLRPATGSEQFAIFLSKRVMFDAMPTQLTVPVVGIEGAAVHDGNLSVRRSTILDLRTTETTGLSRIDVIDSLEAAPAAADKNDVSPLGMKSYESYRFVAVPFSLKLSIVPLTTKSTAEVRSILKIAERERQFEAQLKLRVSGAPIHRVRAYLPDGLRLDLVSVSGTFDWAVTTVGGRSLLTILFADGRTGDVDLVLSGLLGTPGPLASVPLPRLEVLDVEKQQGQIVVQIDPAFDVEATDLRGCEQELLDRAFGWLKEAQRPLARLALRTNSGDYAGTIKLTPRKPTVRVRTLSNVRVSDRAIEETILLEYTVRDAGVREVVFQIPASLADAKISVPQLREKKIEPVGTDGKLVRVRLQLQDEVMGQLNVLVENDRLRTDEAQVAPIPIPETGTVDGRFVTLEGADLEKTVGLEPLGRQQQQWQLITSLSRSASTQAFRVEPNAAAPELTYATKSRDMVETAGARIGLAETALVVDESGAYRAVQTYRVDNKTEQFLTVEMPAGATLWTAWVAGEPVKPMPGADPKAVRQVRVPLVKTAEGDLDYEVRLVYAGKLAGLRSFEEVAFPLIRTVNIKVELSQVRLYLPEGFDWLDFGGTMKLVQDEATLQAGSISYYNKSTEKLAQTLETGDEFAKARASNSLRELKTDVGKLVDSFKSNSSSFEYDGDSSRTLQLELNRNAEVWNEAEKKQQARAAQTMPQGSSSIVSNATTLNGSFASQDNERAKNVVTGIGGNFDGTIANQPPPTMQPGANRFSAGWLAGNGLIGMNNAGTIVKEGDGRIQVGAANAYTGTTTLNAGTLNFNGGNINFNPMAPQVAQGKAKESLQKDLAEAGRQSGKMPQQQQQEFFDDNRKVQTYERRLREQSLLGEMNSAQRRGTSDRELKAGNDVTVGAPASRPKSDVTWDPYKPSEKGAGDREPVPAPSDPGYAEYVRRFGAAKSMNEDYDIPDEQNMHMSYTYTVLAGLDVNIPTRGKLYRFTTPLGDAALTGRPVAKTLVADGYRAAAVVGVLLVLAVAWRVGRKLRWSWFRDSRVGAGVLIIIGLLSLVTMTLPVVGVLVGLAGIVFLLRPRPIEFVPAKP